MGKLNSAAFFILIVFFAPALIAQNRTPITLNISEELSFRPVEAVFLIGASGQLTRKVRAIVVPPIGSESGGEEAHKGVWNFGARITPEGDGVETTYALLIIGEKRELKLVPPISQIIASTTQLRTTTDGIREMLASKKESLKGLEAQVRLQETSLKKLREEVEIVADIGRIVDVREKVKRLKDAYTELLGEEKTLQAALGAIRSRPSPKNFARRELQLTRSLGELTGVVRKSEDQDVKRKSELRNRLQRQRSVIEATQNDDPAEVERKLQQLKRRREDLERGGAI